MDIPPEPQQPSPEGAPPPPYPGQKPLAEQSTVAGQTPWPARPGQDPAPGRPPYQDASPGAGPAPHPSGDAHLGQGPYPGQHPYAAQTPYPGQAPYPGASAYPGGQSPHAGQNPYSGQLPYPGQAQGYPGQGPYPGPGGPAFGYPVPAQGWYVDRTTNGLAIASLVTSLAVACLPLIGLLLGVFGLRQIRRTGQQGRGMAIAGIVISSIATVAVALVVTLGVLGAFRTGDTRVADLHAGQCFNTVGAWSPDHDGGSRSATVDVVPCDEKHNAEAYRVFMLDPELGRSYPGEARISDAANKGCTVFAEGYLGDASLAEGIDVYFFSPRRSDWNRGDHFITCFFGDQDGKITGSVREGASGGDNAGYGV